MAQTIRFTATQLRGLTCPPGVSRIFFQDTQQPELLLQVTEKGSKSYYCRVWNPEKRYTEKKPLGRFESIELRDARRRARETAVLITNGEDPDAERRARIRDLTFAEAFQAFLADPAKRKKRGPRREATIAGYKHQFARHLGTRVGAKKLSSISRHAIDSLHSTIGQQSGPYAANRAVSLISCVYNDAIARGWSGENPATGIEWYPEERRTRFLREDEIGPFIRACEASRSGRLKTVAEALLLALLTGLRRRNVCGARWEQFDLERGVWNVPGEEMKNGDPHTVYLCEHLRRMLLARDRDSGGSPWVFLSSRTGANLTEPRKGLATILKNAEIDPGGVSMHCLKHTFMTYADDIGLPSAVRRRLAAHKSGRDVTEGYTHTLERRVREAYEQVAQHMLSFAAQNATNAGSGTESVPRSHEESGNV